MRNPSSAVLRLLASAWIVACSVYETPGPGRDDPLGTAGADTAGTSASTPGGAGAGTSGTSPSSGGTSGGSASAGGSGGSSPTNGGTVDEAGGAPPLSEVGGAPNEGGASQGGDDAGQGGAPPMVDGCPDDPSKVAPGVCGCGIPDVATPALASCTSLRSKLVHRYDFEGSGTTASDRVGDADGTVVGATLEALDGRGVIRLGGGKTGGYVNLPNKLASALTNATFEAWLTWGGGDAWQRVFDFGDSTSATENNPLEGRTYLFVSPKIGTGGAAIGYSLTGNTNLQEELEVKAPTPLKLAVLSQMVAVVNDSADLLTLYIDGAKVAESAWTGSLSSINDVNVWLGRSQYQSDPELSAVFHEFRVYNAALTAAEVATAFKAGTDPAFLAK